MTLGIASAHEQASTAGQARAERGVHGAACGFESVLLQQVLRALWKSAPSLSGAQGQLYQQMFEGPLAEQLARGGGIGLAGMIERALPGGQPSARVLGTTHRAASLPATPFEMAGAYGSESIGATAQVATVAADMVREGASRWAKEGALTTQDLGDGGVARVRTAMGYQGYYKCNLFALEAARKAGFAVPATPRASGAGYPSAGRITQDADDRRLDGGWGEVVTGVSAEQLGLQIDSGYAAFVLAGSGHGEAHGHMAVVERVHAVDYDAHGQVQRIVFDGYEARAQGAERLRERTWNRYGNPGGNLARNGFDDIEIIRLRPGGSSAGAVRPKSGLEDGS